MQSLRLEIDMRHLVITTALAFAAPAVAATDMTVFGIELGKPLELTACAKPAAQAARPGARKNTPPSAAQREAKRQADAEALAAARADWKKNGAARIAEAQAQADARKAQVEAEKKAGLTPRGDSGEKPNALVSLAEEYAKGEVAPGNEPCVSSDPPPSNDFFVALFNMEANAERMAAPINMSVQKGERVLQILLPDKRCPEWVKCKLYGVLGNGILKALLLQARAGFIEDDVISKKLREKYGKETRARVAGSTAEREWSLPGIHVVSSFRAAYQYVQDGTTQTANPMLHVMMETASRRDEHKAATERREKAQPKL